MPRDGFSLGKVSSREIKLKEKQLAPWLFIGPALLFMIIFVGGPIAQFVYNSFFDFSPIAGGSRVFVGFDNYLALGENERFWAASWRTLAYGLLVVTVELMVGLFVAIMFSTLGKKSRTLRLIFSYPLMVAPIVAGILWKFILVENFGIANELIFTLGFSSERNAINWLSDPEIALISVAVADIWLTTSFVALVLYAGLQNISPEMLEAAWIDGANFRQMITRIVIPLLRPVIAVVLIIRGIDALRAFDVILVQTDGGPQFSTTTLSLLTYRTLTRYGEPGLGSAMGVVFLLGCLILALLAIKFIWAPGKGD